MVSRLSLVLVLLTLELLLVPVVGAAGDIQHYSDSQGTIHIDNRGAASKDKDKDKGKDQAESGLPAAPPAAVAPPQPPQFFRGRPPRNRQGRGGPRPPAPPAPTPAPDSGS